MITIHTATPSQAAEPRAVPKQTAPSPPRAESTGAGADRARISTAAQTAASAAAQEATETPAQTAKEAASGDQQAQRLAARYAAEKAARD